MSEYFNADETSANQDWTRNHWDLPAYKSEKFMGLVITSQMGLDKFRELPVYKAAVRNGLIKDDEWVGAPYPLSY